MDVQIPEGIPSGAETAAAFFGGVWLLFTIVMLVLAVIAWWKIFSKAGYSGALALLCFIPLVNIIVFFWFAFSEWPVLRKAQRAGRPIDDF